MKDLPGSVLALTIVGYWTCVLVLAFMRHLRHHQAVGLLPRKRNERLMWPLWVPAILAWNVLPWLALRSHRANWGLPEFARAVPLFQELRALAAGCALLCFLLTLSCWVKMGRDWSIAVVPNQSSSLVQTGIYGLVRHPIYGLSMALMACSVAVLPTLWMLGVAAVHVALLVQKARSEEESLRAVHGQVYCDYCRRTGRFFPRLGGTRRQSPLAGDSRRNDC
jgi:protein-S-isoprenylcysteine O-methyltransferase Ste14